MRSLRDLLTPDGHACLLEYSVPPDDTDYFTGFKPTANEGNCPDTPVDGKARAGEASLCDGSPSKQIDVNCDALPVDVHASIVKLLAEYLAGLDIRLKKLDDHRTELVQKRDGYKRPKKIAEVEACIAEIDFDIVKTKAMRTQAKLENEVLISSLKKGYKRLQEAKEMKDAINESVGA